MTIRSDSAAVQRTGFMSRAGIWGLALAVFYAVFVRFYQAAGGTIGLSDAVFRNPDALQFASYVAGLVILLGGAACVVLTSPHVRRAPAWLPIIGGREVPAGLVIPLCAVPTLVGGLYGVVHGIAGVVTKSLELLGIIEAWVPTETWVSVDLVSLSLWELLFYEPWFVAMGLCLLLSVRRYALDKGVGPAALRWSGWVCGALVVAGSAWFVWMIATDNVLVI